MLNNIVKEINTNLSGIRTPTSLVWTKGYSYVEVIYPCKRYCKRKNNCYYEIPQIVSRITSNSDKRYPLYITSTNEYSPELLNFLLYALNRSHG